MLVKPRTVLDCWLPMCRELFGLRIEFGEFLLRGCWYKFSLGVALQVQIYLESWNLLGKIVFTLSFTVDIHCGAMQPSAERGDIIEINWYDF